MNERGRTGELAAAGYLRSRAYRIIAANYSSRGYEIDIVAYRRGVLAFVEVKTRSSDQFGTPADAVDAVKQRRIKAAAAGFIAEQSASETVPVFSPLLRRFIRRRIKQKRYDVAEVYTDRQGSVVKINYLKNYFS
jgi:putative endonuclease